MSGTNIIAQFSMPLRGLLSIKPESETTNLQLKQFLKLCLALKTEYMYMIIMYQTIHMNVSLLCADALPPPSVNISVMLGDLVCFPP